MAVPAVSKQEFGLYATAAAGHDGVLQRGCSVASVCSALWIKEGWGFITFWMYWPPECDGELWRAPKGRWDFVRCCWGKHTGRIWEQSKKAACFPEEKERPEKVVGWGNVYERWPLSATFTSWLMLGVGVTYTNRASCVALHFAEPNHSGVCLLQVVISFWSVSWDRSFLLESMQPRARTSRYKNRTC